MTSPQPGPSEAPGPTQRRLVTTPFVSSWLGRARPSDLHDPDPARRAAGWARWTFGAFVDMSGNSDRPYVALALPGQFYDPQGRGPVQRPHLEVPAHLFERPTPEFPDRVAQAGNGLLFPWWRVPEVMAAKRALFAVPRTSVSELVEVLNERRPSLVETVTSQTQRLGDLWSDVEDALVSSAEEMSALVTADFTEQDVAAYFAPAADLRLRVEFDARLREKSGAWASRRVGVWRIVGDTGAGEFVLGVLTPRLTRSSLFSDPLFDPAAEAPGALLVRGLLLRRLTAAFAPGASHGPTVGLPAAKVPAGTGLRAIVARVGEKIPDASTAAAVKFLRAYPDPTDAWAALQSWAHTRPVDGEPRHAMLTVTEEGFRAAHRSSVRAVRRAEDPEREDINVILPIAWDANSRVVRLTFARSEDA